MIGYCSNKVHRLYKHPLAYESGLTTKQGKPFLAGRITFPYLLYDQVTDIRARLYDGSGERYLSVHGSTYYRGADYAYNINTHEQEILITEGEIKALAAWQCGIHAVGLPGILSKRKVSLVDTEKQVICFDSQIPMWHVESAIQKQVATCSHPYILTLPLQGRQKQDIDQYILEYGRNNFRSLYRYAREA
jgi:DNA primase